MLASSDEVLSLHLVVGFVVVSDEVKTIGKCPDSSSITPHVQSPILPCPLNDFSSSRITALLLTGLPRRHSTKECALRMEDNINTMMCDALGKNCGEIRIRGRPALEFSS